ncbi:MAG: bifunctional metallophosphatase/5'-nucleotidase, partial [Planctomycetales bacterium]|nr:bifunctional metallophosphatase/5'-nucleotidase [Planctomycetales bacterium]
MLSSRTALGSEGKKTFTILHTNDLHSNFLGMSPASDYSPFDLDNDRTRGGFARLAALISKRKDARKQLGPVLILDGGDYSMGTAFGAATRETGAELRLMSRMGYDATTLGNHDFDLGPDGLAESVETAVKSGSIPTVVASNTDFSAEDPKLAGLRKLAADGAIRRHLVIKRGGIRFGIFGLLGKGAAFYTVGAGAVKFSDAIETAKEVVKHLREQEKVDVVVCLSHGGVEKGAGGEFTAGEDVQLAQAVPGIDVVIGGHTHTELTEPILVNGRTPVVQTGKYGDNLGELVITLDGNKLQVESYILHPIDDSIAGDKTIADEIEKFKKSVTEAVFASRGYRIDQPLAVVPRDLPNTFTDIAAGTLLANLVTESFRKATKADIGFTANGLMRSSLTRGQSGVQTVYDVFAVAPLGDGIVDATAGSALVTAYFTGAELKAILEFCLLDNPSHPGEYFPRASGLRYFYDKSRSPFDVVTAVEIGDLDRGYTPIDVTGQDKRLYSLACPLYLGLFIVAIPKYTKGKLTLVPKNKDGVPLKSRTEALEMPQGGSPDLLPPKGDVDGSSVAVATAELSGVREIKEWQAIMDYLRDLPA